jgi:hypothetical protein
MARVRPRDQLERMREVLERDRALASASASARQPTVSPVAPPVPAAVTVEPAAPPVCDEPIRTRSMAKLLAAQGHAQRALAIYAYLLAQNGNDPALQAEAAALRESQAVVPRGPDR